MIADQAEPQRDLRLFRIADRGAHAGVGNRHDHIGVDAGLARQLAAQVGAHFVDALAEHFAIRPCEVDVLENAMRQLRIRKRLDRTQAVRADDQHLARLDVAHVGEADQVEAAGFRGDGPRIAEPPERERPEAMRVAHRDQAVFGDQRKRERAGQLGDRLDQRVFHRSGLRPGVEVQHHFGVAVGLEDRSGSDQAFAHFVGVDDVAVVTDPDLPVHAVDQDRLRIRQLAVAGRRVAGVANRDVARQRGERGFVEDLVDVTHLLDQPDPFAVGRRHPGALLPAMLQGVKTEIRQL